jgi:RNA polymerase sigma-70 factor (ECF subfamily)
MSRCRSAVVLTNSIDFPSTRGPFFTVYWFHALGCCAAVAARVIPFPGPAGVGEVTEADLIRAARDGQRHAQRELYQRYAEPLYSCVVRLLGRSAEAEDVVQDAFLDAFQDLGSLAEPERFGGWLRSIAVHKVHRRLRRRQLLQRLGFSSGEQDVTLSPAVDPQAGPFVKTMLLQVDRALQKLAPNLRIAWLLRHVDGQPLEDIAEQRGVSLATIKRHLKRAEEELRQHIDFERPEGATEEGPP